VKNYLVAMVAVMLVSASMSFASTTTVTNRGKVFTVNTLDGDAATGTEVEDQSVEATPIDRRGLVVAHYAVPAAGVSNATITLGDFTVPKGAIIDKDAFIDVVVGIGPAAVSNEIVVGSYKMVENNGAGLLSSSGVKETAATTPQLLTTGGKVTLVIATNAAQPLCTGGVFTVYIPYILGNQR
jgi:hypothetical protein